MPNPGRIVLTANDYYQRSDETSAPVLELSYLDETGHFPWEQGFAE